MSVPDAAEDHWRLTIENAPVGIALIDLTGRFVLVNTALAQMLGVPVAVMMGQQYQSLSDPVELDRFRALREDLLQGRTGPIPLRRHYRRDDGTSVWVDHLVMLVRDAAGEPLHFATFANDVTDQVEGARRIEQMNHDLREQQTRLQRSNDDLEAFAALASHDLQAPLGTVRGYLELLSGEYGEALGEQARDWLTRAAEATERMSTLLTTLLDFSRAAGSGEPRLETVDFGGLVGEVTADLAELVSSSGTSVRFTGTGTDVVCDRVRLHQVLQNLVQNAVKYRHPDRAPVIEVSVESTDSGWCVTVADNGLGVPAADRERVFTMFQQAGPRHAGFGIGLAVSRRIVERHGGRIWIEDNPGGGSMFRFTIPRPGG